MRVPEVNHYDRLKYRKPLATEYMNNMLTFIKTMHPEADDNVISEKLKLIIKDRLQKPRLAQLYHASYGNTELITTDLLANTNDLNDRIVVPSGSTYQLSSNKTSLTKQMILDDLGQRKIVKNKMLDHEAKGETQQARVENYKQSRIKIKVNAISGAMNSPYNCLYDPAGYNSITSLARHGCMLGYGHTERFLEGNFYLPDEESVINWAIQLLRVCPNKTTIEALAEKYKLYQPFPDEVSEYFVNIIKLYKFDIKTRRLQYFFSKLQFHQLLFIYYAFNLKNLFQVNYTFFTFWLKDFFKLPDLNNIDESVDPKLLFKIDEDLLTMVSSINPELLEGELLFDTIKTNPNIARKFILICQVMQEKLYSVQDLFDTFFFAMVDLPLACQQKNLMRKTVIISDTDSVIFTTKSWIEWYVGKLSYDKEAYQINAFVVYMLTKTLLHTFAIMSMNMGMDTKDLRLIMMKNEFLYPVLMRTPMAKHYAGVQAIKEGRVLPKPKPDIKGKNFKGSDLCKETLAFTKDFLLYMINTFISNLKLSAFDLVSKVVEFEQTIAKSLDNRETTYLGTIPIKPEKEYANAESSTYFYYILWENVFTSKYDALHIPQKCRVIPIDPNMIRSNEYLEWLKNKDKKIYEKLTLFLDNNKRKITKIIFPLHILMPEELIPLIDRRHIIYTNCAPLYLALRSLDIGIIAKNQKSILSDFYRVD